MKATQLAFEDAVEIVKEVAVEYSNRIPCSERDYPEVGNCDL